VLYNIYIDNNGDAMEDITYSFRFNTKLMNPNTFLYNTGPITSLDDADWNLRQYYSVTRTDKSGAHELGKDLASPPSNVGQHSTPNYDSLMMAGVHTLSDGSTVFVGQADDPFWVDVGAIFDLLSIRKLPGNMGGGVDGLIANYFYRHNCLCEHCQAVFRRYLRDRFTAEELRTRFGIADLATHRFPEIVSWHPAAETTPLRLEMLRFSQVSNKEAFDLRLDPALYELVERLAAQELRSVNAELECLLREALARRGSGLPQAETAERGRRSKKNE
jgi:hypothetical protein